MDGSRDLKLTYSSVLSRNGKPFISVAFERGEDYAEGEIPKCNIIKSRGFTAGEVGELEAYMKSHKQEIIEKAKGITGFMHIFKD